MNDDKVRSLMEKVLHPIKETQRRYIKRRRYDMVQLLDLTLVPLKRVPLQTPPSKKSAETAT